MSKSNKLRQGRKFYQRREWLNTYESLTHADASEPLEVEDLERLAISAYLIGHDAEFHECYNRAYHIHLQIGDKEPAAQCAFWTGLILLFGGEAAQASGWLARARRLVEGRDCVTQGYLMLPNAEEQLAGGDAESAYLTAISAAELGNNFKDLDLIACAHHLQGRALIKQEQVQAGLALLDETMLTVIAGELSPIMTGLIYCSLIEACHDVYASSRAREWTDALTQWCEQQPQLVAFTGVCLIHRAQIMQLSGDWPDAMAEVHRACERASERGEREPPALALYQQAELHRLKGEFTAADEAYRKAGRLGCELQPGLALLRLRQGRSDASCSGIRRAVRAATDPLLRTRFLPAYVEIMLATANIDEARAASDDLVEVADRFSTDELRAMAIYTVGSVDLAEGNAAVALGSLRQAFELWQRVDAPYESARVRLTIGQACCLVGDDEAGEMEFDAAKAVFDELGAAVVTQQGNFVAESSTPIRLHPLTPREAEVLRLIAEGKTNKTIAEELFLSERTIDRHVSNILTKLEISSRSAATAYAYRNKLV